MSDIRARVLSGERVIGTMINIVDHIDIVKIFKICGFDYFMVDCEHGYIDYGKIAAMAALAKEMNIAAFARIPGPDREAVLRLMDMGMDGLMMPNTESTQQAEKLVELAKYAPMGNRGISLMRGHSRYNPTGTPAEYMCSANENTMLIVQIESVEGLAHVDEIMQVEGIDVAFIGPNDLCQSLGVPGDQNNPLYIQSVRKVIKACSARGKQCGIQNMSVQELLTWYEEGVKFGMFSNEVNMLLDVGKRAVKALKK